MGNKQSFPAGTVGWVGSTMRENQQEDVFLHCDPRLVAVNVGPDGTYGSLVYDTNQNNEFDPERSAWLQSAFRVIKKPLGDANAIGFQLNLAGNGDTKGGYFVDRGDGSSTKESVPTGGQAHAGSGMVASGPGVTGASANPDQAKSLTTTDAGRSGGIVIGQGSYNDGGPFHVGNKADKHNHGFDADGNPINALHIDTKALFYKNQVQDGPLRFEDTYKSGRDQNVIVPVHLGWTGNDWAWWSTTYFYNPDPPSYKPTPTYYPKYPTGDRQPTPTGGGNPTPTSNKSPTHPSLLPVATPENHPHSYSPSTFTPFTGALPGIGGPFGLNPVQTGGPLQGPPIGGGDIQTGGTGGDTGGTPTGGGPAGNPPTPGDTGGGMGSTPQPGDITGYTPAGIPIRQPPTPSSGSGSPGSSPPIVDPSGNPDGGGGGTDGSSGGGGAGGGGGAKPIKPPEIPIYVVPPYSGPVIQDIVGTTSTGAPAINTISSTAALVTQVAMYSASNYGPNSTNPSAFGNTSAASLGKSNSSDPFTGAMSSFGAQGGGIVQSPAPTPSPSFSPSPAPAPSPSAAPATNTGAGGDPWVYTATPRDQRDPTKPASKYSRGTANGGIVFHPPETDLRDVPKGMVPDRVTLSTMIVAVGPNAYFAAGVPELVNGSIKSGYRWGVDTTNGDLVFYSVSFSQPPLEAIRFGNAGQTIRWKSTNTSYGEIAHNNTSSRIWGFPDKNGTVAMTSDIVGNTQFVIRQQADQPVVGVTFTASTNLSLSVASSTSYYFKFTIEYTVNVAVSGSKVRITGPAAPTNLLYWAETTSSAGTIANASSNSAFSVDVGFATATTAVTYFQEIEGLLENGANAGSITLEFANATALDTITLKRGSFCVLSTSG